MKKEKISKYKTIMQSNDSISYLTKQKEQFQQLIKINEILNKYEIRHILDIDKMPPNNDRDLLAYSENEDGQYIVSGYKFDVPRNLPSEPIHEVSITHKHINKDKPVSVAILKTIDKDELEQYVKNIPSPTDEQLKQTRYNAALSLIDYDSIVDHPQSDRSAEVKKLIQEKAESIPDEEAVNLYYKGEINQFIRESRRKYLQNLTPKEVRAHYQRNIDKLQAKLEGISELINNPIQSDRGLATPNDLRVATMGTKQDLKWRDIDKQHQDKVKDLLKSTAPEILAKIDDDENPNEIISQFIGIKLIKKELRILKTLRAIVDRFYKLGMIQDHSHKTKIYTADFYKEYGLKPRKEGGYDDNQTQPIRKILFGSGNLTKRMFFNNSKHQKVMVTAFILRLEWETDNNYFEVTLDDIIFVKDKSDKYSYYYENLQGLNRLMELMPNSDSAFELHEYLEYSLKADNQPFGLTKLLNASPTLAKRYKKDKNGTIERLEKVLDGMIEARTLIKAWRKVEGKNETNYILTNLYTKEKNSKKAQVIQIKQNR
jgi:hypothetical protein